MWAVQKLTVHNLSCMGPMLFALCVLRPVLTTNCWFCARSWLHLSQRSLCCIVEEGERGQFAKSSVALSYFGLHSLCVGFRFTEPVRAAVQTRRVLPSSVATPDEPPPSLLPAPFPAAAAAARVAPGPGAFSIAVALAARAPESPPCPGPFQVPFLDDVMENLATPDGALAAAAPAEAVAREPAA